MWVVLPKEVEKKVSWGFAEIFFFLLNQEVIKMWRPQPPVPFFALGAVIWGHDTWGYDSPIFKAFIIFLKYLFGYMGFSVVEFELLVVACGI